MKLTFVYFCSEDEDPEYKPLRMPFKDDLDDFTNSPLDDKYDTGEGEAEGKHHLFQLELSVGRFAHVPHSIVSLPLCS